MKKIIIAILLLSLICLTAACGPGTGGRAPVNERSENEKAPDSPQDIALNQPSSGGTSANEEPVGQSPDTQPSKPPAETPRPETLEEQMKNTIQVTITMQDGGVIVAELYPDVAPQSVRNFVSLARQGFYDGLKFHRIIKGFMIQGGCPNGNGMGNPGYSIYGEFAANGFDNDLKHDRGVLSMARSSNPDSAGSQFFIMHANSPHLDGSYAAFGQVTSGIEVVDRLAETPVTDNNGSVASANMPVIASITIDDDIELPEPDKLAR